MKTRVYLKQHIQGTKQSILVLDVSEIYNGERYFIGWLMLKNGSEVPYQIREKDVNRMVKQGRMVRFQ